MQSKEGLNSIMKIKREVLNSIKYKAVRPFTTYYIDKLLYKLLMTWMYPYCSSLKYYYVWITMKLQLWFIDEYI